MTDRRLAGPATALVAAAALLLAACSGGGGDDAPGATGGGPDGTDGPASLPACPLEALDDADGPVEVVVWHSQTAKPAEAIEALADEYNASQDRVVVRLENQGTDYTELVTKYVSAVASGDLPDVLLVDDTATQLLADSGTILPGQACFDADGTDLSVFDETARAYYTVDGALQPGSVGLANVLLFYNRDHFRRAGLDPDDPPGTLDELRTAAQAISDAGISDTPLAHEVGSWKTEFWLTGAGAPIVDPGNGREGLATASALDSPTTRALWTWLRAMDGDGLLLAVPSDPGNIDHYFAMANERASMLVESSSAATSIEAFLAGDLSVDDLGGGEVGEDVSGLEIGAGPFPGIEAPGRMQVGGNAWYVMSTGGDAEQAAAWNFVQFLNEPDSQVTLALVASTLPWRYGVVDDERIQDAWSSRLSGRWLALAWEQQQTGLDPAFPGPLIGPYDEVRAAIEDAQERLLLDGQSVDDAIASADADITAALEQYADELG